MVAGEPRAFSTRSTRLFEVGSRFVASGGRSQSNDVIMTYSGAAAGVKPAEAVEQQSAPASSGVSGYWKALISMHK